MQTKNNPVDTTACLERCRAGWNEVIGCWFGEDPCNPAFPYTEARVLMVGGGYLKLAGNWNDANIHIGDGDAETIAYDHGRRKAMQAIYKSIELDPFG